LSRHPIFSSRSRNTTGKDYIKDPYSYNHTKMPR
jgi:hypothetical protein